MTNSQFCVQQRQQEQQRLKKLLIAGFAGSTIIHGILAYAVPRWSWEPSPQVEEPIELTLIEPKPQPKPKIESKPVVEPKPQPVKPPEPVKAETPPPPVKPPEPVKAQTIPPKPTPQKVLTTPTPTPSQPIVSAPVESRLPTPSMTSSLNAPTNTVASPETGVPSPGNPGAAVATNSAPPRPDTDNSDEGISCVSNCEPEYPAALEGVEGDAGVKLTIDPNGNVIGAELIDPHSNSGVNRQALLAARQMQFSSPGDTSAAVRVNIDFTVEGSEYDRLAREAQARKEQAEQERKEQEAARQQQVEAERQARQEQMERERQARQRQQESTPPESKPAPLPALLTDELEAERIRKFRERMEQRQGG